MALGKIGGPAAAEALTAALANAPSADRATLADSCLMCAEQFRTAGMKAEALALYQRLRAPDMPRTTQIAATRGMLLVRATAGAPVPDARERAGQSPGPGR